MQLSQGGKVWISLGVEVAGVLVGKDLKKLRREGVEAVRELAERVHTLR